MPTLPMFPLGTVLLPGGLLPVHVFEDRYRRLVQDCLAADREFGVVLIERGSEVGGGDTRTEVGTVASIVQAQELPDGRWALGAVGVRRVRVERWLDDDPYPRAEVEDWPDGPGSSDDIELMAAAVTALRQVLALRAELGEPTSPATIELPDEAEALSYAAAVLGGLGPADRYDALGCADSAARLHLVTALLEESADTLQRRLALDS